MKSQVVFQIQSVIIVILMYLGVYLRNRRSIHVKIMSTVIIWDILLILQIELTRGAINKAMKVVANPLMLNIHVTLAVSTVLLYGVMIYTGRRMLKGEDIFRTKHRIFGFSTVIFRTATFITSFFAV